MKGSEIAAHADFDLIRYAQVWEDADCLLQALRIGPGDVCLSIASAGDNALSMLAQGPARVVALDLSAAQLHCLKLRVAAYRTLRHGGLLQLMGSRACDDRGALLAKCRPALETDTAAFWDALRPQLQAHGVAGVGKFERYFRLFRRWVLPWVHSRARIASLLTEKSEAERQAFYARQWNSRRWRWLLRLFFSRTSMGALGRDPAFFAHVEGRVSDHVARRVAHALQALAPAENPYLHWILTGTHGHALPHALRPENFDPIRTHLDRLDIRHESVEDFAAGIAARGEAIDAFNLSDIFEYMSPAVFEQVYGTLIDIAHPGARLAYWNMMVPRSVPDTLRPRIDSRDAEAEALFRQDKAFFYARFVLETVRP